MPPLLAMIVGAGLLAVGTPPETRAQSEVVGKPPDTPFELIAPGRVLTVIVPSREAEIRHAGPGVPLDSSQFHRVLVRRFAEQHFLDIAWVQVERWDALVPALAAGKGDLIAADVTVTESRKAKVAFTVPAHRTREHIVVRKGDRVESFRDLVGRKITIREQSSFWHAVQHARRAHPGIEVRLVPENTPPERLLAGVAEGRLDMAVVNVGDSMLIEAGWPTLRVVSRPFKSDAVAWAVNPHAPNLLRELDRFLSIELLTTLANGERYGDLTDIKRHGVLRIVTRNNAATFFLWRGEQVGFEFELLREFAKRHGLHVEVMIAPQHASLFEMLERGAGDIAAASLPMDVPPRTDAVAMTRPFNYVYDYLVARRDDDSVLGIEDLAGRAVTVRPSSAHWHTLQRLRDAGLKLDIAPAPEDAETETLIAAVGEGRIDLTVAASHVLDIELGFRTDVRKAFSLRGPVALGWAVRRDNSELLAALNEFLDKEYRELFFNVVYQKYFENPVRMQLNRKHRVDHAHADSLSPYDEIVQREAAKHHFDWRLIVAQMYQESRFNPKARSPAGAIGLMQMLPRTAREFGVGKLRDPEQSVRAGVSYLAWLHSRFEPELTVKDRIWFALAAYNAGFGHVTDARKLASGELGLDPDRWFDNVEVAMRLLSKRAYYRNTTHGYVRGREVVKYVREIRERYRSYLQITGARERSG
ncbi:MAG: transporter substrate-binding domain-containing protein [Gammaproteobacteria bacterium]|nr:transporter substrate-binding domain-containing protein [Gammaproteobacteria bacterium]